LLRFRNTEITPKFPPTPRNEELVAPLLAVM